MNEIDILTYNSSFGGDVPRSVLIRKEKWDRRERKEGKNEKGEVKPEEEGKKRKGSV